jgi:predicted nucleic acid-binding protein
MRTYVDPAALIRRISRSAQSTEVRQQIHESWWVGDLLATSALARTELTRFALRFGIPRSVALESLAGIELVPVSAEVLQLAADDADTSLDLVTAVHVASAVHIEAEYAVTYDARLAAALEARGISVRGAPAP